MEELGHTLAVGVNLSEHLSINIDLSKIKIKKIFKWIKSKKISDQEMIKTFNCGIGFCLILPEKNINKVKKFFSKRYEPYEIGFVSKSKSKVNLTNKLKW